MQSQISGGVNKMITRSDWEVVVGLEVHAQVSSRAKLFSGASTLYGGAPNSQVSLLDAGMPGMLPVINKLCIEQAVKTGLGLNAKINLVSIFDRKNYFYADLPQGYQISQYKWPIVGEGRVAIELPEGKTKEIGIAVKNRNLAIIDAPVSGGTFDAENASLTFMVGGRVKDFKFSKPILSKMGKKIILIALIHNK